MSRITEENPSFEQLLARVEELVRSLESGDLGIEEAMNRYEEGMKAVHACRRVLDQAEKRIEILIRGESGALDARPFDPEKAGQAEPKPKKKAGKGRRKAKEEEDLLF